MQKVVVSLKHLRDDIGLVVELTSEERNDSPDLTQLHRHEETLEGFRMGSSKLLFAM